MDFFTAEAGQDRRKWLNSQGDKVAERLRYMLGPDLYPPVDAAARGLAMISPGADVQDAYQASGEMMAPGRSALDRAGSGAALAASIGAMLMPGGVSSLRQGFDDVVDAGVRAYDPNTVNAFTAWHGSPHDFDRFSLDRIGTGEGAQAYGHGLYFAENPGVARSYRDALSSHLVGGKPVDYGESDDLAASWFTAFNDREKAAEYLQKQIDNPPRSMPNLRPPEEIETMRLAIEKLRSDASLEKTVPSGRLYEVSIDAEPEDFLDWDAPLSAQPVGQRLLADFESRRQEILSGIPEVDGSMPIADYDARYGDALSEAARLRVKPEWTGAQLYESSRLVPGDYRDPVAASEVLQGQGIPGIRYLDAGSRGAGDGSRNYVVFDDALTTIVGKDGQYTPAQNIANLLREGRASEVTDDMLGALDPNDSMELMRLYEAGATGADMPMDTASRMARAEGMGFDTGTPRYHGTGIDFTGFSDDELSENTRAFSSRFGHFTTTDPDVASNFGREGAVLPITTRDGRYVEGDVLATRDPRPAINRLGKPVTNEDGSIYQRWRVDPHDAIFDMAKNNADISADPRGYVADRLKAGVQGFDIPQTIYDGVQSSWHGYQMPHDVRVEFNPTNIRSRFARFDPRLSHLSNLNAGIAGAGAVGLGLMGYNQQDEEAQMRAYLGGI